MNCNQSTQVFICACLHASPPRAPQVKVKADGARAKSWRFDELRDLLAHNPNMSVRFHAALARAMTSKLVDTHNPAVKYRQLLQVSAVLFRSKGAIVPSG